VRVLFLAAGYGTRLYPLTVNTAKTLININNTPMINFLVAKIEALRSTVKINEEVVVSNSKFYRDFVSWKKKYKLKMSILDDGSTSPEDRLGAVGDINFSIKKSRKDDWLVLGADNIFDWSLKMFLKYCLKKRPYPVVGLYDIRKRHFASRFGVVKMNRQNIIKEFQEKPHNPKSTTVATCIYFFPKESLTFIDAFLKAHRADAAGKFLEWLIGQTKVYGYTFRGTWLDIGHKDSLNKAEKIWR